MIKRIIQKTAAMEKEILSTFEAARYCQVHPGTIKNWIKNENLKAFKTPGGHRRIYKSDLDNFLNEKNIPVSYESLNRRKKVLIIVTDYREREKISRTLLRWAGFFEIAAVSNCFEAGELLVLFKPDLVILDETLPGINAAEVCRHIKSSLYLEDSKILVLAKGSSGEKISGEVDAVLSKPIHGERLLSELERILRMKNLK
jgi:excisionase family DNA binding protein